MKSFVSTIVFLILLVGIRASDSIGCFSSVSVAKDMGTYYVQSTGYCSGKCLDYAYYALKGSSCYCLKLEPSSEVDSSKCDNTCDGWKQDMCGGSNVYNVYEGTGTTGAGSTGDSLSGSASSTLEPSSGSSSGSASATSSSSPSSAASDSSSSSVSETTESSSAAPSSLSMILSSTPETSTESDESSASASASSTVSASTTLTTSSDGKVASKTRSVTASATSSTSTSSANSRSGEDKDKSEKKSSTNVGAIAGGVVGGVVGGVLVFGLIFFCWRRHANSDDEDDEEITLDKPSVLSRANGSSKSKSKVNGLSLLDRPMSNPFSDPLESSAAAAGGSNDQGLVDPRLNPMMMGRRRLSDNSLADEADYSRKILQVANPD